MKKQKSQNRPAKPGPEAGETGPEGPIEALPAEANEAAPSAEAPEVDVAALRDRMLRLQADFENFRRRTQRERADIYRRANEDLLTALLPVLDHFELGFENAVEDHKNESVIEGFRLVFQQTLAALGKFGLKPLEAQGRPFDPHLHEAVTQVPSEDIPADTVVAQTRRGYMLDDRLLRPAQVVVSCGPAPPPAAEEPDSEADGLDPAPEKDDA